MIGILKQLIHIMNEVTKMSGTVVSRYFLKPISDLKWDENSNAVRGQGTVSSSGVVSQQQSLI